jgi:hypothetical protein
LAPEAAADLCADCGFEFAGDAWKVLYRRKDEKPRVFYQAWLGNRLWKIITTGMIV